jgi:hypothetical protein
MTPTSRLLERILVQFQELDNGSTSFKLTAIIVLSLPLVFVAHRIRNKQQKATLSIPFPLPTGHPICYRLQPLKLHLQLGV